MTADGSAPRVPRVAIADDSYLVREALRELLASVPETELVAV